ncbi:GPI-linked NAD(P)(+)--arginine ADP-ribosyltransferase 1 [Symphorus nematophorus]
MLDKRKLLLAAIVFTALYCKVTAVSVKLLEAAPGVVDDLYIGCRKQALEKFIHSELLGQELNRSEGFHKAWRASSQCPGRINGGIKQHTSALLAYAHGDPAFKQEFNRAVETLGGKVSTYKSNFHFKSFHFLLMDSITLLHPTKECKSMYLVTNEHGHLKAGNKVRLTSFTLVSSNYKSTKSESDLDESFLFNITSCFFANLGSNFCMSDNDEALLSPAELFTVENVKTVITADSKYTEIVLKHSELDRSHNCYIFSRSPADVSTQWPLLMLVASSLFFFNC